MRLAFLDRPLACPLMGTVGGHAMNPMRQLLLLSLPAVWAFSGLAGDAARGGGEPPDGWTAVSPRAEIRPEMTYYANGGRGGKARLVIKQDEREGLHGYWSRSFSVKGGGHYWLRAWRRVTGVETPRIS